ncbi:MAG: xanthine dehydrogenase family protein molybdopterin-binding subunit, partial [Acidimicrobiales bacterium]
MKTADKWVGRDLERVEDRRLLTGNGRYVANHEMSGALHLVMVRSPLAHARIASIETAAAAAMPGVRAVVTASDLGQTGTMPLMPAAGAEIAAVPIPLLAGAKVRYAGEAVAGVVATSLAEAMDAAELVEVEYEELPVVVDPALAEESEPLHDEAPNNVLLSARRCGGDVEGAFGSAYRVVAADLALPRLVAAPMEPRAALASYDEEEDLVTCYLGAQDPHRPRAQLAAILERPAESVRVVVEDVGGSFGSKGALAPEAAVAAILAMRLKRPVSWIESRSENFLAAHQGRGQSAHVELALAKSGKFLGVRVRLRADLGAYLHPATTIPPLLASTLVAGVYEIGAVEVSVTGVATNKVPTGPYRGAGRPEAAYFIERIVDLAARELSVDPVELRRRNLVAASAFPFTTALGGVLDSGDYPELLRRVCEMAGYEATRERHELERAGGRLPGLGVAVFLEPAGLGLWESASLTIEPDGSVVARVGSSSNGQGHETVFAQVTADALGIEPSMVAVRFGDSADVPAGMGTYSSRSAALAGSALVEAARGLTAELCRRAEEVLGSGELGFSWSEGAAREPGGRSLSLRELAGRAETRGERLEETARFSMPGPVYSSGAFAIEVEIDRETGELSTRRVLA